jgi:predicted DNA binding CopG/RHH family protein
MSRYRATMSELLQKVHEQDKDHEISMARGELEAIADKATQLASALKGKSDEGNPLEAWVQSKITKAKDYINSVSDYMLYNPDMKQNEETILEKSFTSQQIKQAYGILNDPRYKGGNYDGAVKAIEKLAKGLSDHPDVKNALKRANEELEEGKIKDIFTANKEGESIEQIAKRLNMSVATVKKVLGEEVIDEKIADSIIKDLQKAYGDLKGKTISPEMATKISKHLDGQSFDVVTLRQLMKADIPFISTLAKNKIYKKTGKFESLEEQPEDIKTPAVQPDKKSEGEGDVEGLKKQLIAAQGQIDLLKQKLENEKNKAIKPEPNPETGEVPLTVGVAYKYFKDKEAKETKKEAFDNYPTSDINKHKQDAYKDPKGGEKKPINLGAKMTYESIAAVKNKAEKTGMPYSILKQVYDRGMAAWRGGHRPGATQVQWALARVNSFVTKSSGTWGGADKDLAAKVKGSKN